MTLAHTSKVLEGYAMQISHQLAKLGHGYPGRPAGLSLPGSRAETTAKISFIFKHRKMNVH